MHIEVPAVTARELTRGVRRRTSPAEDLPARSSGVGRLAGQMELESSASVRARVVAARRVQEGRFARVPIHYNAQMGIREIEQHCRIDDATRALLHKAMEARSMSARAAHRVLRVARTIADLASAVDIGLEHVAEAVQYQCVGSRAEP